MSRKGRDCAVLVMSSSDQPAQDGLRDSFRLSPAKTTWGPAASYADFSYQWGVLLKPLRHVSQPVPQETEPH